MGKEKSEKERRNAEGPGGVAVLAAVQFEDYSGSDGELEKERKIMRGVERERTR